MTDTQAKIAAVDAANHATARIILSDPFYESSIMWEWAQRILGYKAEHGGDVSEGAVAHES